VSLGKTLPTYSLPGLHDQNKTNFLEGIFYQPVSRSEQSEKFKKSRDWLRAGKNLALQNSHFCFNHLLCKQAFCFYIIFALLTAYRVLNPNFQLFSFELKKN